MQNAHYISKHTGHWRKTKDEFVLFKFTRQETTYVYATAGKYFVVILKQRVCCNQGGRDSKDSFGKIWGIKINIIYFLHQI